MTSNNYSASSRKKSGKSGFGSVNKFHVETSSSKASLSCSKQNLLTVFQAAPLVWHDNEDNVHPVSVLDFESEQKELTESISYGHLNIDIAYDIASAERLQLFLARGEGRVLHFSCHGHPDYLAIEDGWGAMHQLRVSNLRKWISAGGNNLLFVFVSACHSRSAGEAFLKAGVKHVVCCQQDDQPIRNFVAVYFAKAFYQALANGKRLGEAFELARQSVLNCPELDPSVLQSEVEKFALLPEGVNHDISIFQPSSQKGDEKMDTSQIENPMVKNIGILPVPPHIFEGRQVEMYHILNALKFSQLIRVTGSEVGIGRCSIVQAVCQYIQQRKITSPLRNSEILWLPCQQQQGRDELSHMIENISMIFRSNQTKKDKDEYEQKFINHLYQNNRKVLVIDARMPLYPEFPKEVASFITKIITSTRTPIIMIHNWNDCDYSFDQLPCVERDIIVDNLDFVSTVHLFGKLCQHVAKKQYPGVSNHLELSSLLIPEESDSYDPFKSYRGRRIFKMLGEGIPAKIHRAAKNITVEEYKEMISLALRKIHCFEFESRIELDKKSSNLALEVAKAAEEKRFLDAQEFQDQFDEIEILRESLPDYFELLPLADSIQTDQQRAVKEKNFLHAQRLQEEYEALQEKIGNEKNAMERLGIKEEDLQLLTAEQFQEQHVIEYRIKEEEVQDISNDATKEDVVTSDPQIDVLEGGDESNLERGKNDSEKTRVGLETKLIKLEEDLVQAIRERNYACCTVLDSQIAETKQKVGNLPTLEELVADKEEYESFLTQAVTSKNWHLADDIKGIVESLEQQIELETRSANNNPIDASAASNSSKRGLNESTGKGKVKHVSLPPPSASLNSSKSSVPKPRRPRQDDSSHGSDPLFVNKIAMKPRLEYSHGSEQRERVGDRLEEGDGIEIFEEEETQKQEAELMPGAYRPGAYRIPGISERVGDVSTVESAGPEVIANESPAIIEAELVTSSPLEGTEFLEQKIAEILESRMVTAEIVVPKPPLLTGIKKGVSKLFKRKIPARRPKKKT